MNVNIYKNQGRSYLKKKKTEYLMINYKVHKKLFLIKCSRGDYKF